MIKYHKASDNKPVAELLDEGIVIRNSDDVLGLIAEIGMNNCNMIIVQERNLHKDFFRLSTGLAGDILQKFSNYRVRLIIAGDFPAYKSNSLNDFIRESNRGNLVFFSDDLEAAYRKFTIV